MKSLKDRIIDVYEDFIRRKEKEAEQSWKKNVKYRAGTNDENGLMENYEDCWHEKFPHKNTMTPFEFYKVMMSNYDTRDFIKSKTGKQMSQFTQPNHDDDVDNEVTLKKKAKELLSDFKNVNWNSVGYIRKVLDNPKSAKEFKSIISGAFAAGSEKKFENYIDKQNDKICTQWEKLDDLNDDGKLSKEQKVELKRLDILNDALDFTIEDWYDDMCLLFARDKNHNPSSQLFTTVFKKMLMYLVNNKFSNESFQNVAEEGIKFRLKLINGGKKKEPKKLAEDAVPPIVKVMYKSFMEKMKVKYIYRAVNVDTEWVDDQLDKMEDKWNQEDKAEYLRKNKYKERMGLANVNLHAVGKSWAWSEDDADDVCGGDGDTYIIEAENDQQNIDLPMSALCFAEWSHFKNNGTVGGGECEVQVLNELDVTVTDVFIGKGKNKTHLNRRETYYREEN